MGSSRAEDAIDIGHVFERPFLRVAVFPSMTPMYCRIRRICTFAASYKAISARMSLVLSLADWETPMLMPDTVAKHSN